MTLKYHLLIHFYFKNLICRVFVLGAATKKALFPHYSMSSIVNRQDNLDDCVKLTDILSPIPAADVDSFDSLQSSQCVLSNEDTIKFGLFADQLTALKMIENQGKFYNFFFQC